MAVPFGIGVGFHLRQIEGELGAERAGDFLAAARGGVEIAHMGQIMERC